MSNESKPREFWIGRHNRQYSNIEIENLGVGEPALFIHVIEHSAYRALEDERDEIATCWDVMKKLHDEIKAERDVFRDEVKAMMREADQLTKERDEGIVAIKQWIAAFHEAKADCDQLVKENAELKRIAAFASGDGWNELPKLRLDVDQLTKERDELAGLWERTKKAFDDLAKDHADDWKRIQDAERERDELNDEIKAITDHAFKIDNERLTLKTLAAGLAQSVENYLNAYGDKAVTYTVGSCHDQFLKALTAWLAYLKGQEHE